MQSKSISHWEKLKDQFEAALSLSGQDRKAFLQGISAEEPEVGSELKRLIENHEAAGNFLEGCTESSSDTFTPGKRITRRYRIVRHLGRGGMGEVYLAEDSNLKRLVALKFLTEETEGDPLFRSRLRREAHAAAAVDHPYICKIYDMGEFRSRPYIAMEYVDGRTVREKLLSGPIRVSEAVSLSYEIVEAVMAAHLKGIVHGDLKPSNLMITPAGHIKLMDFGIARRIEKAPDPESTGSGTARNIKAGTLLYMSPEQLNGKPATVQSDIFSLGLILYEIFTGVHPFRKETAEASFGAILYEDATIAPRADSIPDIWKPVMWRLLAKSCLDRYNSVEEILSDLKNAEKGTRAEFATSVTKQLQTSRLQKRKSAGSARPNIAAYELYLKGRYEWNQRKETALRASIDRYHQAIALDPSYAAPYAGLADSYVALGLYGLALPSDTMDLARSAAEKALDLDRASAEGMTSLACVQCVYDWTWKVGERNFRRAIQAHPRYSTAHRWFANHCLGPLGRFDEAHSELRRALELDPASRLTEASIGALFYFERRYDEAIEQQLRILKTSDFGMGYYFLGQAYTEKGMLNDALRELERAVELNERSSESLAMLGRVLAELGRTHEAEVILEELLHRSNRIYVSFVLCAILAIALKQFDRALGFLDRGVKEKATDLIWIGVRPLFDPIRTRPEFLQICKQVRLIRSGDTSIRSNIAGRGK